jgi:16S rRNA (guanine(966)-N(2))-methyltransferase RsmD
MRVIAGTLKGRVLQAPSWDGLRPTSDRLRETLFNILAPRIEGARVLDVCAGTGAVGIEALSRGAAAVTFVDTDHRAVALIEANLRKCGVTERYTIDRRDALARVSPPVGGPFDIVFLDPPYAQSSFEPWLGAAAADVAAGGVIVLEHASRLDPPAAVPGLQLTRRLRQGDSSLAFYAPGAAGTEA